MSRIMRQSYIMYFITNMQSIISRLKRVINTLSAVAYSHNFLIRFLSLGLRMGHGSLLHLFIKNIYKMNIDDIY